MSVFGQIYLPDEVNIHTAACSTTLIRTIKLSISELGGNPYWMGPFSSVIMDAGHVSDAAIVIKNKNQYKFFLQAFDDDFMPLFRYLIMKILNP